MAMQCAGTRYLIALAATAVVVSAPSAEAETARRTVREGVTQVASAQAASTYRRAALNPTPSASVGTQDISPSASPSGTASAGTRDIWSAERESFKRMIAEASAQYAVPERLIWAVIRVESGFDHRAVSPKGAGGLMQLMPDTAAILGVRDVFDPRENIHAGTRHLRAMMQRFRGDLRLAIAAYNAGEKAVAAFRGIPPYRETRDYVARVMRFYRGTKDSDTTYVYVGPGPDQSQNYGSDVHRFVGVDGTVTYTNIPHARLGAVAAAR
jgi:soluble lytic murein transglycosylase-like protein